MLAADFFLLPILLGCIRSSRIIYVYLNDGMMFIYCQLFLANIENSYRLKIVPCIIPHGLFKLKKPEPLIEPN